MNQIRTLGYAWCSTWYFTILHLDRVNVRGKEGVNWNKKGEVAEEMNFLRLQQNNFTENVNHELTL